jgi:ABC-type branched-subunit amino acid transport system ATPase component
MSAALNDSSATATRGPTLAMDRVSVHFGGVAALVEVSLEANPGDVLAVVGPNGAGKTTLLNAVCGLTRGATRGRITVLGRVVSGMSPLEVARCGVGRSFQNPALVDRESVLENVLAGSHLQLKYGLLDQFWRRSRVDDAERRMRARAMDVLELAAIGHLAEHAVADLPYGTRKLIDVSRAMVANPRLLLLDEPTSGLDCGDQEVVRKIVAGIGAGGHTTVLLVEHHMDVVRAVANRVIGLHSGHVLARGTPGDVLDSETFRAALVGSQLASVSSSRDAPRARGV